MKKIALTLLTCTAVMHTSLVLAGPLDPECTAEKAAKSAATKAAIGVGGRCKPAEAASDTAKNAVGIEDKGPLEERRHDDEDGDAAKGVLRKTVK